MNRRIFLATTTLALLSPALGAEILTGQSAKMHGQRDRALKRIDFWRSVMTGWRSKNRG